MSPMRDSGPETSSRSNHDDQLSRMEPSPNADPECRTPDVVG